MLGKAKMFTFKRGFNASALLKANSEKKITMPNKNVSPGKCLKSNKRAGTFILYLGTLEYNPLMAFWKKLLGFQKIIAHSETQF